MENKPRVSVIVCFLNAERFLAEAIDSVFSQTFQSWELLLVDDGSTDSSTAVARRCSEEHPQLVKYLEHQNHGHRGLVISRNAGAEHASGDYFAVLDSDDVWLPRKLEQQVAILDSHPRVSMVLGATLYWHSWAGNPGCQQPDFVKQAGVPANRVYAPPALLKLFLSGAAGEVTPSNWLFRREVIAELGGFEETFSAVSGMYEDQAFLAKAYLKLPVFVSDECWDRYRQHPDSLCARVIKSGQHPAATIFYLNWTAEYLSRQGALDAATRDIIRCQLRPLQHPLFYRLRGLAPAALRRVKRMAAGLLHG